MMTEPWIWEILQSLQSIGRKRFEENGGLKLILPILFKNTHEHRLGGCATF